MTERHEVTFTAAGKTLSLSFASSTDHIAQMIRQSGTFYEAEMLADARSRLFFPKCAVDVGAHVGNHTLYFAHMLGIRTLAFEPNPVSFSHLAANVAANGFDQLCSVHNVAVGAAAGRGHVEPASDDNSGMAMVQPDPAGPVEIVALDHALAQEQAIDLIKIDVEGWELEVLRGSAAILARHRPVLYIEITPANFGPVCAHLEAAGYRCWKRFNVTPTFLFLPRERLGLEPGAAPQPIRGIAQA